MGAGHGKEDKINPIPPPASVYAIRNILTGPSEDARHFNSLDRSLKGFLRQYNMGGLEYRLRLAGVYTLDDLAQSSEAVLSQHGFTPLMARRLFQALVKFADQFEEQGLQQKQIRRSTILRTSSNFGKPNKRRNHSFRQDTYKRMSSPAFRKISISPLANYKLKVIGLSPVDGIDGSKTSPVFKPTQGGGTVFKPTQGGGRVEGMNVIVEGTSLEEITDEDELEEDREILPAFIASSPLPPDDFVLLSERILQESPTNIEHHLSMPTGLDRINNDERSSLHLDAEHLDRSLSCPCLTLLDESVPLISEDNPNELQEILSALQSHEPRDVEELLILLYSLFDIVKFSCLMVIDDIFNTVSHVLYRHLNNLMVAEISCRIIKYLTINTNHNGSLNDENLEKLVTVILDVVKYHPFSKRCQLNGCLVINNVFRSGRYSNIEIDNVLSILSCTLDNYQKDEQLILGVLTAMVAVLASVSDSLTTVSQQLQMCLEQLCVLMDMHQDNVQIVQYILSFFTLSLISVAPLVDDNIMKPIISQVMSSLNTHKQRSDVVVYGCKTISQIAPHKLIEDDEIGKELTDCILELLSVHPKSSGVQTWSSYALYQLASYNNTLIPYVKSSGCLERRKHSLPHLNEEARSYVEQLATLATI